MHSISWQLEYILQDISVYVDYQIFLCKNIKWRTTIQYIHVKKLIRFFFFFVLSSFLKYSSTIYFPLYAVKGWVFWNEMFRREQLKSMIWFLIELPFDMVQLHLQDMKTNLQNFACYKYILYFLNQYPPLNNTPLW